MAQRAGAPLTKPEVVELIRRAIERGDEERARLLTVTLARRVNEERDRRSAAQKTRRPRPPGDWRVD